MPFAFLHNVTNTSPNTNKHISTLKKITHQIIFFSSIIFILSRFRLHTLNTTSTTFLLQYPHHTLPIHHQIHYSRPTHKAALLSTSKNSSLLLQCSSKTSTSTQQTLPTIKLPNSSNNQYFPQLKKLSSPTNMLSSWLKLVWPKYLKKYRRQI